MTYNILIVGLKGQDAGKTTFALALLAYLREKGHNACAFKPRAGNNVWYDFDVVHDALSQGRLYGKDATRLKAASAFSAADDPLSEECINPIHRLWMEPPRTSKSVLYGIFRSTLTDVINPKRANFFAVHFFGSHCPASYTYSFIFKPALTAEVAPVNLVLAFLTYTERHLPLLGALTVLLSWQLGVLPANMWMPLFEQPPDISAGRKPKSDRV
ncbi:putative P-loop ATPase/GTPase [Candidatus Methanophagaceae archaeon]|nr:putative P-loop ATPase/GTPase [Methanophagales archaeon]